LPLRRFDVALILRQQIDQLQKVRSFGEDRIDWRLGISPHSAIPAVARRACGAWAWILKRQNADPKLFQGRTHGLELGKRAAIVPSHRLNHFTDWAKTLPNARGPLPKRTGDQWVWALSTVADWLDSISETPEGFSTHELRERNAKIKVMANAASEEVNRRIDAMRQEWASITDEPFPGVDIESIRELTARCGMSLDRSLEGKFTLADVWPGVIGYMKSLKDKRDPSATTAAHRHESNAPKYRATSHSDETTRGRFFLLTILEILFGLGCWEFADFLSDHGNPRLSSLSFFISLASLVVYVGLLIHPVWQRTRIIAGICIVLCVTIGLLIIRISGGAAPSVLPSTPPSGGVGLAPPVPAPSSRQPEKAAPPSTPSISESAPSVTATTAPWETTTRQPFQILRRVAVFHVGDNGYTASVALDANGNFPPYTPVVFGAYDPQPLEFVAKNWILYVNATFDDGRNFIELKEGNPDFFPPGWDMNQDRQAMEVVDPNGRAIFQVFYDNNLEITIYGVFMSKPGEGFVADKRGLTQFSDKAVDASGCSSRTRFPPIFKYPSSQHLGERILPLSATNATSQPESGQVAKTGQ
jgi:hypothetical protein